MPRAVALFSGGLDSALAVRILQEQGFEVEALNIRTTFDCCKTAAAREAAELGVRLTVRSVADDYVELIQRPSHGYGKGVNPCVDCRIYMCRMAKRMMNEVGACTVITGEVLGQRPMSQKRRDLEVISRESGLEGWLLRPLSAKLLSPTEPELRGLVDRQRLYDFVGRGRGKLIELAVRLRIRNIPSPSTGCALTELNFAPRVRDLMEFDAQATRRDFELLNIGRHFRFRPQTKVVVGRDAEENAALRLFAAAEDMPDTALLEPANFVGPDAFVVGQVTDEALQFAGALMLRYTRRADPQNAFVRITHSGSSRDLCVRADGAAQSAVTL